MMQLKLWAYAIAGALLATLGVTSVYFKNKAKRLSLERDMLKATVHAERTRKKIEKKERYELSRRESDIKKEIKNDKVPDNLTNSNDW